MESVRLVIACWRVLELWGKRCGFREFNEAMYAMARELMTETPDGRLVNVVRTTPLEHAADELADVWQRGGKYHEFIAAYTKVLNILNELEQARQG